MRTYIYRCKHSYVRLIHTMNGGTLYTYATLYDYPKAKSISLKYFLSQYRSNIQNFTKTYISDPLLDLIRTRQLLIRSTVLMLNVEVSKNPRKLLYTDTVRIAYVSNMTNITYALHYTLHVH